MVRSLTWSQQALDDIDHIAQYIAQDSLKQAQRVVSELFILSDDLILFPYSGRVVPEAKNEMVREKFLYSYRVIYQIKPNAIEILTVSHAKRQLFI